MREMPPSERGAPAPQGKQPSPDQIVAVVGEGLMALGQMLEGKPQLQDKVADLVNGLQSLIAEISGEGAPEQEEQMEPQGQPASMNQGGNANARPSM